MPQDTDTDTATNTATGSAASPLLRLTAAARDRVVENLAGDDGLALRVQAERLGPAGFDYLLTFVGRDEREPDDRVVDAGPFPIFVDTASAAHLAGTTIDFVHTLQKIGFEFDNPNAGWDDPVADAVQRVIDDRINPKVGSHGGLVTLLEVRGDTAVLEMHGGCQGCGQAEVTLRDGIEGLILEAVPAIRRVLDTTDHEAGETPYFEPGHAGVSPLAED